MTRFEKNFKKVTGIDFNAFYKEHYQKLIYYLNGWTKDTELSEDIADEAFIQCLKKVDKFDPEKSQAHTWLFTVARNMTIKNWKDGNKLPTVSMDKDIKNNATLEMFLPYNDSKKDLDRHELIRRKSTYVKKCIHALPEKQSKYKTVLILREIDAMSYDEIADYLDLNLSTVKSQIKKGREIIRKNSAYGLDAIERRGVDEY